MNDQSTLDKIESIITQTTGIQYPIPGALTYLSNKKYTKFALLCKDMYILVDDEGPHFDPVTGTIFIPCKDPEKEFIRIHNKLNPINNLPMSQIGRHYTLLGKVSLGKSVNIGYNTVIGGQGFKIIKDSEGNNQQFSHIGGVKIGSNVSIGNNTCIDRGTFGDTIIEDYVFIDNLVHISHNCHIKKNAIICVSTICGSVVIGENTQVSPGAVIREGVTIGNNCHISMGAIVTKDVPDNTTVAGFYAVERSKWLKIFKRWLRD